MKKKRNAVEWAMHYRQIIILVMTCLVAFGVYSLPEMRKNEFPDFTIRQGVVVAVAPGNTAQEMLEQVTKPLEEYIFTYKEVRKEKTISKSRDGITYIQVYLNDELQDKDTFWSKFKHGVSQFKSQLPSNVVALQVNDDFGDTSALLITMESEDKTYRELDEYMDLLQDRLRRITSVGRMSVSGMQQEQISVYIDPDHLSEYKLDEQTLATSLMQKGFTTSGGCIRNGTQAYPIYVAKSLNTIYDVLFLLHFYRKQQAFASIIGNITVRGRIFLHHTCHVFETDIVTLRIGIDNKLLYIVKMGEDINEVLAGFQKELPQDVTIYRITDQSKVVGDSVENFLNELIIAIVAVIVVVMLLLPMRVALVASSTIPISIFISLGLFYALGIELNTVTLAALIVTLGMIVDNSIVIIDSYLENIGEGMSRWHASIQSTMHFFKSIFSATLAISITFFPFLITTKGMINDFLQSFPWATTIVLFVSLLVATLLVPFVQFWFIRKPMAKKTGKTFSFLDALQGMYNKVLDSCIAHPKLTIGFGLVSIVAGAGLLTQLPQQLLPCADRNQFAVEITLPTGTRVERTAEVADSLEHILRQDPRVVSVASFKGCASPRFQNSYAPQIGGANFAQFIVNTIGNKATVDVLNEYAPKYTDYFPDARIRFKQLSYSEATYPIEVRLTGEDLEFVKHDAEEVLTLVRQLPQLILAQADYNEPLPSSEIVLREDEATRIGITNLGVETTLAMRYGKGIAVADVWEGDYNMPVVLKSVRADCASLTDVRDELLPVAGGLATVPLRQVADVVPTWKDGQLCRRNGVFTVTVQAELQRGKNGMAVTALVQEKLDDLTLSPGVTLSYGGDLEDSEEKMPQIMAALIIAAVIIFFILVVHFHKVNLATLVFSSMFLCVFGTAVGVWIQGCDFSMTCTLGIVALMGIIVRNGIIMFDYAEELRTMEGMASAQAIYHSARRRMRPIFLTSAAASMGVIPMILGGSGLWMPMGTVICYGTLITMVFILTVLPCSYLLLFRGSTKKRLQAEALECQ